MSKYEKRLDKMKENDVVPPDQTNEEWLVMMMGSIDKQIEKHRQNKQHLQDAINLLRRDKQYLMGIFSQLARRKS